jgi:hypothetical protein
MMTRSEYEQRRRALEQQLQADMELLRAAHETRMHALENLWRASSEEGAASPAFPTGTKTGNGTRAEGGTQTGTQAPPAAVPVRKRYGEVGVDVARAFPRLPEVFDKAALVRELGYEPPRSTLFRAIEELLIAKRIVVETYGTGRNPTRYRKVGNLERQEA